MQAESIAGRQCTTLIMNTTKYLFPVFAAAALWCRASEANTNLDLSGAAFHVNDPTFASCGYVPSSAPYYFQNNCAASIVVSAALPFIPTGTSAMTLWIDGYRAQYDSRVHLTCTVSSSYYDWTYLGSANLDMNTTGNFDLPVTLNPAALIDWAYLSVSCDLTPGSRILGVIQSH